MVVDDTAVVVTEGVDHTEEDTIAGEVVAHAGDHTVAHEADQEVADPGQTHGNVDLVTDVLAQEREGHAREKGDHDHERTDHARLRDGAEVDQLSLRADQDHLHEADRVPDPRVTMAEADQGATNVTGLICATAHTDIV